MLCKGCGEEFDHLSGAGFCSKGICSIMETGYLIGLRDVKSTMVEQARIAQRIQPIRVNSEGEPLAEVTELKRVNAWP
jgi:hypothetical protein